MNRSLDDMVRETGPKRGGFGGGGGRGGSFTNTRGGRGGFNSGPRDDGFIRRRVGDGGAVHHPESSPRQTNSRPPMYTSRHMESASASGSPSRSGGSIVKVSNLDYNVDENDLRDLFAGIGALKKCTLFYDREGKSTGQGEVTFLTPDDAKKALDEYDGAMLDNRQLKLKILTTELGGPVAVSLNQGGQRTFTPRGPRSDEGDFQSHRSGGGQGERREGGHQQAAGGSFRGGRGGNRGPGGRSQPRPQVNAEGLDAEMDAYFGQQEGGGNE